MASDLTRLPLAVSTEWLSKTVTTDPPRLTPHEEWRLAIRLAASVEFRVAVVLYSPAKGRWGLRPEHPASDAEIMLHFFPHSWSSSDLVQINWGWQRITVTDPEMKLDPRAYATLLEPESACGVPLFDRGRWRRVSEPREAARNRRLRAVHGSPAEQATIDRGRAEDRRVPTPDRVLAPHRVSRTSLPAAGRPQGEQEGVAERWWRV
jgi:hypothetical protein